MARLATRLMLGAKLEDLKLKDKKFNHHGAKEAAGSFLPNEGAVLISLSDKVNLSEQAIEIGKEL